jgi:predicted RNase H-like nuclease
MTFPWHPPDPPSYSYLLGLYLGDGWVSPKPRGGAQLIIVCATEYPQLIEDCWAALILVSLNPHVTRYQPRGQRCVRLMSAWKHWIDVFPQHGPGRKHERTIELADWQREIVDRFPREFLRGLLHSDGCRTVNRFKTMLPSGRVAECLSAVVLLQPVGGHPRAVLRVLRAARDPVDAVESPQHLDLAPDERRAARLVRAGEGVSPPVAVGADGARGGWAVACLYDDGTRLMLLGDIGELAELRAESGAPVAIDMPIGLLDTVGFRPCDLAARGLLGPRASTVFAPPARYQLAVAGDYPAIRALVTKERRTNPAAKGLSAQSAGIARKVREVDDFVRAHPDSERWLFESHPELSFLALNGGAPVASKRSPAGAAQRLRLIASVFPDAEAQLESAPWPRRLAGPDDWLDAYAGLATAAAISRGEHAELGDGARDAAGIPMRIARPRQRG